MKLLNAPSKAADGVAASSTRQVVDAASSTIVVEIRWLSLEKFTQVCPSAVYQPHFAPEIKTNKFMPF